jgi:hypothetical protein
MPQSTMPIPINAGKGSCIRIRQEIKADSRIKRMGATGNHQPLTGSFNRKSVEAASARESTAEKMM